MYFIVRDKDEHTEVRKEYSDANPAFRKVYHETCEEFEHKEPKELARLRRQAIRRSRYYNKDPQSIAEAAAIRRLMEKEING